MTFQFGKNPEYTITVWHDFTNWALPFKICWRTFDINAHKNFEISLMFLCFGIEFEIWWWEKLK